MEEQGLRVLELKKREKDYVRWGCPLSPRHGASQVADGGDSLQI
jgi:hypothetical protein